MVVCVARCGVSFGRPRSGTAPSICRFFVSGSLGAFGFLVVFSFGEASAWCPRRYFLRFAFPLSPLFFRATLAMCSAPRPSIIPGRVTCSGGAVVGTSPVLRYYTSPREIWPSPRHRGPSRVWLAVTASLPLLASWAGSVPVAFTLCYLSISGRLCSGALPFLSFRCLRACCLDSTGGCSSGPGGAGCLAQAVA